MPHKVLDARLPDMVAHIIGFVLQNLPALLFVVALLVAAAPGNAGVPFYMDIICPTLAIAFLLIAKRQRC
jgi:hypothetical protein